MKVRELKNVFLFVLCGTAVFTLNAQSKTKVVLHEVLELLEDGTVNYKGVPFTGESWAYYTSPRKIHEKYSWKNGQQHGPYIEFNEVGTFIAKDTWVNGKKNGGFEYRYGLGQAKAKGTFKNGKLDGQVWGWYYTGTPKYYGNYSNGMRNGRNITFFKDGDVEQIANFKNDQPHGTIYSYYPDSVIRSEIEYANGLKNGYSYKYHLSGCPAEEAYFKQGKLDSVKRVYEEITCRLIEQSGLKNGKKEGPHLTFDFTGDSILSCSYVDNELDGYYKSWHLNQVETIGNYDLGQPMGYWYYNMSSGKQMRHGRYQEGKMIAKWYFYDIQGYLLFTNVYDDEGEIIKQKFYKKKSRCIFEYPHKNETK